MSAPSVSNSYYKDFFQQLIAFDIAMANAVTGKDMIIILVDKETKKVFKGKVPKEILLESNVADIWVRDIGTVSPKNPMKFVYRPNYLEKAVSNEIDTSFNQFANQVGLKFRQSKIVLDGGNFVDNGLNRAVLTERIFKDKPEDTQMLKLIQSHTGKKVVPVYSAQVADLGGSVRCLAFQLKGELAERLIKLAKKR